MIFCFYAKMAEESGFGFKVSSEAMCKGLSLVLPARKQNIGVTNKITKGQSFNQEAYYDFFILCT